MNKNSTKKLFTGSLQPGDIEIEVIDQKLALSDDLEGKIDRLWGQKIEEANEKGLNLYNGESYRCVNWKHDENLKLTFTPFNYKHRFGCVHMIKNDLIKCKEVTHNGVFVGGTVKTADNKYIMLKLSGKSMNTNQFDLIGGVAETNISCEGGKYLFDVMLDELEEEANVGRKEIESIALEMMYEGINNHVGFYFNIRLSIDSHQVIENFKSNDDVDIDSLLFYNYDEYIEVLKNHNENKRMIAKHIAENEK